MLYRTEDLDRWGVGKGSNLTPAEIDGNFWDLAERLVAVEASAGEAANGIANITVTGSQMTVWLEDGTALGPYTLPTAMIRYRGDWTAATSYSEMDLVAVPDTGIYLVLQDHSSGDTFDASARDAENNPLYRFLFPIGAGASALADLSDVWSGIAPADGNVLTWDGAQWDAYPVNLSINDLSGIYQIEGATTGQVLVFNPTGTGWWEPTDLPSGGGASALGDLTDVTLATPAAAEVLRFDGTGWVNAPLAWDDISDRPATIDALPAAVGAAGTVLKAGAAGTITWGTDETGAGGGVTTFLGLSDTPGAFGTAGQAVVVNATGDALEFIDPAAGGAAALDDLADVAITTPAAGEVLRHDGAGFVNAAVAWGDLAGVPATFPPEVHTHAAADIGDLSEALDDRVAALLVAGTNITLTYDDAAGALTIDAAGGGGAATFLGLTDTPGAFGAAGQIAAVNATTDALEFIDPPATGLADAPLNGNLYGRADGAWAEIVLPIPEGAYRYWRMRLISETQADASSSEARLGEIQFRSAAGVAETATGGTPSGDWDNTPTLFDGLTSGTTVHSPFTDKVAKYDFGSPRTTEEVAVYAQNNLATYAPTRFVIEASNDDTDWTEVARADPITPAWSGFGTVSRTLPVTVPTVPVDADTVQGVTPSAFGLGLLDDADAAAARGTLGVPGLTTDNTLTGRQSITGRLMATGGGYLKNGFLAMPGQGPSDSGMTGLYDRNELALAHLRGTVTLAGTGPMTATNLPSMFDGSGDYGTISGTDDTTTRIEIVIEFPANLPLYASANWQPFLQYRLATGGVTTWYNQVTVEVSPDGATWYRPSAGQWETADFHTEGPAVTGVAGLWMGQTGNPQVAGTAWRYARFILEDRRADAGYASRDAVWIAELGLRHVSAPYARQLLRSDGGAFYGGYWAKDAAGGDQGRGTINATALYDDGTLLCAPIEEAVTGGYDPAIWARLAPHGGLDRHEAMKARGFRPASADSYADEIDGQRGIPGYWTRAEWAERRARKQERQERDLEGNAVTALVEDRISLAERHERALLALDYAALAIRDLARRVQALEAGRGGNG